jgi:hypothetical protein
VLLAGSKIFTNCFTAMRHSPLFHFAQASPKDPETCACKRKSYVNCSLQGGLCYSRQLQQSVPKCFPSLQGRRALPLRQKFRQARSAARAGPSTCLPEPPKPLLSLRQPRAARNQLVQGAPLARATRPPPQVSAGRRAPPSLAARNSQPS